MRIYVDTNIFIDFYQSAHDAVGVFEELLARADRLILTEQTVNEFERNRANVLSELIDQFRKSVKVRPHTTSIVRALPEWEPLIEKRDQFEQQADLVQENLARFLADPSSDPVYKKFFELVGAQGVVVLPTTDLLVARAQRRKVLGNPPNSPDKITVGDELIWEALLEGCKDDLVVVSRDATFGKNKAILEAEFAKRTAKKLVVLDTLTSALKFAGTASPLIEKEEQEFVDYDDFRQETSWDAGSARALEGAYSAVDFDFEARVMRVPANSEQDYGPREIASLEEFDEWITEVAFAGYEESAPRDSGEWVFEFDESRWIDEAQLHFEDELTKLGWLGT